MERFIGNIKTKSGLGSKMIYIYAGKNFENKKEALNTDLGRFLGYERVYFDEDSFNMADFEGYIGAKSLFGQNYALILNSILADEYRRAEIFKKIKEIEDSENVFFFMESDLTKTDLKSIEKKVKSIKFFEEKVEKAEKFNVFALTDAFAKKDKKETWVLMQKALISGVPAQELVNILTWSIKSLILVKGKKDIPEDVKKTGLNPFVFKKALSASRAWDELALKKALQDIVFLYHDERRGEDLATNFELYILKTL